MEKEASRNDVEMEANEYKEQEGSEVGRRLWNVHAAVNFAERGNLF